MKKVLILTYYYPPTGGAGVQRILKFTKYLPGFRWQPLVIAPKRTAEEAQDKSLLKEIPKEAKIWRTFIIEPRAWAPLKRFWKKEIAQAIKSQNKKPPFLKRILDFLRNLIFIPDDSLFWLPSLVWRGFQVTKEEKPKVIFATAPPYTVLIAGVILKKILKLPLVVDFRDPWTNLPQAHLYHQIPSWRKKIDLKLERWVLKKADKIVVASYPIGDYFVKDYQINSNLIEVITNGFDEDDFKNLRRKEPQKLTITYAGSFFGGYNPFNFLKAMVDFLKEEPKSSSLIQINFIGRFNQNIKEACLKNIKGVKVSINFTGYLNHKDSLSSLLSSTLLLLVIGKGEGSKAVYTGKIFEYIVSQKPILALVPKGGVAAELLEKTKTGIVVDPEDISEIEKAIKFLYQSWQKGEKITNPNQKEIQKYERKKLTQKLTSVFNKLI